MRGVLFCVLMFVSVLLGGCTKTNKAIEVVGNLNKSNIQKVSNAFSLYGNMNNFKSPKNKEELVNYIKTSPDIEYSLNLMQIDPATFEDLFISEVDGEEFVIRYKSRVTAMGGGSAIAFEKTGVDGIRRVGLSNGTIVEADDAAYDRLMAGKLSKEERAADSDNNDASGLE